MNSLFNFKWLMATILLCTPVLMRGAENISLPMSNDSDLGSGWNASYDATTQTITFTNGDAESGGGGLGWWLATWDGTNEKNVGTDYSDYEGVQLVIKTSLTGTITLVVQYDYYDDSGNAKSSTAYITGSGSNEEQTIYCAFDDTMKDALLQIYLQYGDAGSIALESATIIAKTDDDETTEGDSETLTLSSYSTVNWTDDNSESDTYNQDSGSITVNSESNTASLTFTRNYGGLGWYNSSVWDLSDYDAIEVTYKNLSGTSIDLYVQNGSSNSWVGATSDSYSSESGTITFAFADHATLDYTDIENIVIQCGTLSGESATVTITSIKFIKYTTTEGEGEDENGGNTNETNPYISVTDEGKAYLNFTTAYETWGTDDAMVSNTESVPNSATITISGTEWSGGAGCKYSSNGSLDITDYYQMVVNYTVTATDEDNQAGINVKLNLYSGSEGYAGLYDSQNTGTMRFTIANSVEGFDPTDINKIMFQANYPCTITVSSIEFLTEEQAATSDENMLYSKFYLWNTAISNGCTKSSDSYVEGSDENDHAPFKINGAHSWDGGNWWFGNVDEDQYWGIEVKLTTTQSVKVRIAIQYYMESTNSDYTEKYTAYCTADEETTLILPFLSSYDHYVDEVFIQLGELQNDDATCDITITSAKLVGSTNTTYQGDYVTILTSDTDGWATYYLGTADYRMPLGLKGTAVKGVALATEEDDEYGTDKYALTTEWEYKNEDDNVNGGDIVPAGTPLVLKGIGDDPYVTYTAFLDTTNGGTKPETNWLHGTDEIIDADKMEEITNSDNETENGEYVYYKLSYKYPNNTCVGFYWGDEQGVAFDVPETHKAWLAIAKDVLTAINTPDGDDDTTKLGFILTDGDNSSNNVQDSTTGIATVPSVQTTANDVIYNIQGVRVNEMSQKGIYIVNGKKVVKQ